MKNYRVSFEKNKGKNFLHYAIMVTLNQIVLT